ncbi:MAG: LiaI-LiaF-like domain-containing protein [Terriglobales bacterium]
MNCAKHTDMPVAAYCRTCGKALCETCKRDVRGVIYCEDCLAARVAGTAAVAPTVVTPPVGSGSPHPAVAGVLAGFFPFGVGQAYNGQFARGFVYLVVFIALVWAINNAGPATPLFGIGIAAYYFFQLIDAVRSANAIRVGLPAPDPFGVDNLFGPGGRPTPRTTNAAAVPPTPGAPPPPAIVPAQVAPESASYPPPAQTSRAVPISAVVLIVLGVLFLVGNLGYLHFHWLHGLWPLVLVGIGVWLLADRWPAISSGTARGRRLLMGPVVLLVIGGTLFLDRIDKAPFGHTWPLILIAIGVVLMWQRVAPTPPETPPPPPPPPSEQQPDTVFQDKQEGR